MVSAWLDRAFTDLKADPTMYQANRDAREREADPTKNNRSSPGWPVYDGGITSTSWRLRSACC